mmetsp:Transcript_34309/g.80238  ORF Transcript_34309/g.80238 Transcript_34309/m.80238 type:complete len:214 (+) Transcript_34309:70-711(+)
MPIFTLQVLRKGSRDEKALDLQAHVTVQDVLAKVAALTKVPASKLYLTKDLNGEKVKLLRNEVPHSNVQIGGLQDLSGLPDTLHVEANQAKDYLTREEAIALQDELIEAYCSEVFQRTLRNYQDKFFAGTYEFKDYNKHLHDVLKPAQAKVLPRHGFKADPKGVYLMERSFDSYLTDEDIQCRAWIVSRLIGTDMAWRQDPSRIRSLESGSGE